MSFHFHDYLFHLRALALLVVVVLAESIASSALVFIFTFRHPSLLVLLNFSHFLDLFMSYMQKVILKAIKLHWLIKSIRSQDLGHQI